MYLTDIRVEYYARLWLQDALSSSITLFGGTSDDSTSRGYRWDYDWVDVVQSLGAAYGFYQTAYNRAPTFKLAQKHQACVQWVQTLLEWWLTDGYKLLEEIYGPSDL